LLGLKLDFSNHDLMKFTRILGSNKLTMTFSQKRIRLGVVLLPALLFCVSLTQNAFIYEYQGKQVPSSISIFLMGGFAILGGGGLEWLTWLANPIAIVSCIRFLNETNPQIKIEPILRIPIPNPKPISHWLSLIAAAIAWSFSFWNEILAAESGSTGQILGLEYGYWLWVSSLTALSVSINIYYLYLGKVYA
jgi:hypothetical protein